MQRAPQALPLGRTALFDWHLRVRDATARLARPAAPRKRPLSLSLHCALSGQQRVVGRRAAQLREKPAALRRLPQSRILLHAFQVRRDQMWRPATRPQEKAASLPRRLTQILLHLLRCLCRAAGHQATWADSQRPPPSQAPRRCAGRCSHAPHALRPLLPWLLHAGLGADPAARTPQGLRARRRAGFARQPRPAAPQMLPPTRPTPSTPRRGRLHLRPRQGAAWHLAALTCSQARRTPWLLVHLAGAMWASR